MINLMYVVLMAMLALNISSEVLNGFSIVEESLNRTTANSSKENEVLYGNFAEQMKANPQKVKKWFEKATAVKRMSDSLYNFAQSLKEQIVIEADGKDGNIYDIKNKDNLEAASHVMLAPGTGQGKRLYNAINSFRQRILSMVTDPHQRSIIESNLTTKLPKNAHTMGKNWQEYMFEDMPVAGAVTLLSKLQSDVRYAEGEVLHTLVANIDMKDIRVNKLSAFVIPESKTVISGDQFSAQIVMAAVDTTQQPEIYVGGQRISNGLYRFTAGAVGEHSFGGYITMRGEGNLGAYAQPLVALLLLLCLLTTACRRLGCRHLRSEEGCKQYHYYFLHFSVFGCAVLCIYLLDYHFHRSVQLSCDAVGSHCRDARDVEALATRQLAEGFALTL